MTTRTGTKLLALAAALFSAGTLTAAPAEAGMGVRVNFGFPLGHFYARPSGGGGYSESHAKKKIYARKTVRPARVITHAEPKKQVVSKPSALAAAASAKPVDEKAIVTGSLADPVVTEVKKPEAPVTGALPVLSASTGPIEEIKAIDAGEVREPVKTAAAPAAPAEPAVQGKGECRKFVPSVGLVISVACEE